jgi:hypothetical protein
MTLQSESLLQGSCGIAQIPQPDVVPPGLHESMDGQSVFELQTIAPSGERPASPGFVLVEPEPHPTAISKPRPAPKRTPPMFASVVAAELQPRFQRLFLANRRGLLAAHVCRQDVEGMVNPMVGPRDDLPPRHHVGPARRSTAHDAASK